MSSKRALLLQRAASSLLFARPDVSSSSSSSFVSSRCALTTTSTMKRDATFFASKSPPFPPRCHVVADIVQKKKFTRSYAWRNSLDAPDPIAVDILYHPETKYLDAYIEMADAIELAFPSVLVRGNEKEDEEEKGEGEEYFRVEFREEKIFEMKDRLPRMEEIVEMLEERVMEAEKEMFGGGGGSGSGGGCG